MDGINENSVVIVGAGLSGCLLACFLAKKNMDVIVLEKASDPRIVGTKVGKSINMALSERGRKSLSILGIEEHILKLTIPMYGRMVHDKEGKQVLQYYSTDHKRAILSISRFEFNVALLKMADLNGAKFQFDAKVESYDTRKGILTVGGKTYKAKVVIACDGSHSYCRKSVVNYPLFNYSHEYLDHGYKELYIPPSGNEENKFLIEKNALHIWPRGTHMLIALPNSDGSFTCTLFLPHKTRGNVIGFDGLRTDEEIENFFKSDFPDAYKLMPNLVEIFRRNPIGNLMIVKCFPWTFNGRMTLVGDAAHAMVPFFGQGMNASFEDVTVLNEIIDRYCPNGDYSNPPWDKIFEEYENQRKDNADAISEMAVENYIEMRDKCADETFIFKSKIQKRLAELYPNRFFTRYEMVSFTNIPYTIAKEKGKLIDKIVDKLLEGVESYDLEKIDFDKIKNDMDEYFPPGWTEIS